MNNLYFNLVLLDDLRFSSSLFLVISFYDLNHLLESKLIQLLFNCIFYLK